MKIGFIGLGKLGYPVATAMVYAGHDVMGYDLDPVNMTYNQRQYQELDPGGSDFNITVRHMADNDGKTFVSKESGRLHFGSMGEVAAHAEVIFVAVQTPHDPEYEGITPIPLDRKDFDYHYITDASQDLANCILNIQRFNHDDGNTPPTIAIISTMLPGTMRREIMPIFKDIAPVVYNPAFIAMGTTWRDFIDPEFVLLGGDDDGALDKVRQAHIDCLAATMVDEDAPHEYSERTHKRHAPFAEVSIESAELTKVAYNTFIGLKIGFANTIMEICHEIPNADCDEVIDGLSLAHRRIISPTYLRGGMGDGGGCHPRDNIAMSYLAQELKLSCNPFEDIMHWREYQTDYLMRLIIEQYKATSLPVVLMGTAFKPGTNITTGSPALLLADLMTGQVPFEMFDPICTEWDPRIDSGEGAPDVFSGEGKPCIAVISCKHELWERWAWIEGSIVIDPHRYIADQDGITVIRVGEG